MICAEMSLGQKQTMQSLRHYTIEETYELGDAILDNDLVEEKRTW
jgi:XTP/dITP diphosphohydrolase